MQVKIHQSLLENSNWIDEIEKIKDYEINIMGEYTIVPYNIKYENALLHHHLIIEFVIRYLIKILDHHDLRYNKGKLERFVRKTFINLTCHPVCNLIAVFYFEKLLEKIIDRITRTRVINNYLGILVMISSKMWEDNVYNNNVFLYDFELEKHLSEKDWLRLEKEALEILDYQLYLSEIDFQKFINNYKIKN